MMPKIWLDLNTLTLAVFLLEQVQSYRVMVRQLGLNQAMVFPPVHMHRTIGSKANTIWWTPESHGNTMVSSRCRYTYDSLLRRLPLPCTSANRKVWHVSRMFRPMKIE